MKHTKLLMVVASSFAAMSLASCGTKEEKAALEKVMKGTIITENATGAPVVSGTPSDLDGYKNTCLDLTTLQVKNKKNVKIEWKVLSNESAVKSVSALDDNHNRMRFDYGSHKEGDENDYTTTEVKLQAKGKCGGAKLTKEFTVNLKNNKNIYDKLSLENFYRVEDGENKYAFQNDDYTIAGNHGQQYRYVEISGKLEYMSPDGNWGLLSDGNHVVELYQLTKSTDYDQAVVGKYLTVWGSISQYNGNLQVQYCNFIEEMSDHSAIADMVEYGEMKAGMNTKASEDYVPFTAGIMNRVGELKGAQVVELQDKDGKVINFNTFNPEVRQVLKVTKGGNNFMIAYDYHVSKGDEEVATAMRNFFGNLSVGQEISLEGTIRYNLAAGLKEGGEYQITPFLKSHVS